MDSASTPLLPGEDLVQQGLKDLAVGEITECSLLLLVASPRLRRLGIEIPEASVGQPVEHQLYDYLAVRFGNGAHSKYNSLLRRIDSYAHALEREQSHSRVLGN
jgi:hypothetical protein